ncbi:MAG: flagellar hook protein FlgE [Formivibrio sp.]|nr:flagellar hook protein FlgE [Formivibrio sp.]
MGFQQGLSGLSASSQNLDVIGNNISNANTVGFKGSRAEFGDIYASSFASSGNLSGIGAKVTGVAQQFGQGNITTTDNPLDVAITGNGFFRMQNASGVSYTRNGQFQVDNNGYIVNGGDKLTGYVADPITGALQTGTYGPLQLTVGTAPGRATGGSGVSNAGLGVSLNLNASSPIISRQPAPTGVGNLSITDPSTYTNSTSTTVYDSLGTPHTQTFYFTKVASNQWEVQTSFDGAAPTMTGNAAGTLNGYLMFDSNGALDTTTVPIDPITTLAGANAGSFTYQTPAGAVGGATDPLKFTVNFAKSTQFGNSFGVNSITNDGFAPGELTGISIGNDGVILGNYSNGQSKNVGQIVLADFQDSQGLQSLGNNRWRETAASGPATINTPGSSNLGSLQSGAVEASNVDLTAEMVNLITAQRNYQANAQTIKAQDTIMQTLVSL